METATDVPGAALSTAVGVLDTRPAPRCAIEVYGWCMTRTNIDIDDALCQRVMDRFHLSTKREAVNLALRHLAGEALTLDDARNLRGSGWDADLDEIRTSRS